MTDIEAEIVQALRTLTGEQAGTRYSDPRPDRFIHVRRKGGPTARESASLDSVFRDKPLIDIMVSAETEEAAMPIADQIQDFMLTAKATQPFSVTCYGVTQTIRAWSDDILDGVFVAPRIWLSYSLNLRY
jgi:hypothetical protein